MPFILGDHNEPLLQLYRAEFDTEEGTIRLECWSMSPTDAAATFKNFFKDDHPYRVDLIDSTKSQDVGTSDPAWIERMEWWRSKPVPTGDEMLLYINPGTRVNVQGTVIEYTGAAYLVWSCPSVDE